MVPEQGSQLFSQAVCVVSAGSENLIVGVHIADVSHYLKPDTALDQEAANRSVTENELTGFCGDGVLWETHMSGLQSVPYLLVDGHFVVGNLSFSFPSFDCCLILCRGTSVYLVQKRIDMIPTLLSTG